MGFVISLFYFGIYYLSPAFVLGPLAAYHVQQIIVVLAMLVSIPALTKSFLLKTPQTLALIGLTCAVFLSRFIGSFYLSGGREALIVFVPSAVAYFLICLHCNTKKRLQVIVILMFCVCVIVISKGYSDLLNDVANSGPPPGAGIGTPTEPGSTASPYLMRQMNDQGVWTYRLQGLGEINDPNDFGQLQVCLLPLMFVFWQPKKTFNNLAFVILPCCVLLFGLYLTHSRGALVAITALLLFAGRRRIGIVPSIVLAGGLFLGAMALQFTGGRDISATAGEDRTALWGQGMEVFRTHPLFGVGFGRLWEYTDAYLTAHNSIIVCSAELGVFGFYFWALFLFPTMRDAFAVSSSKMVTEGGTVIVEESPYPGVSRQTEKLDKDEFNRLGLLIFLSLMGFLVAGWFLSRAFVVTLFLLGGLAESIYQMALQRGMISPRLPFLRVLRGSALLAVGLISAMYVLVRILNLTK